MKKLTEKQLSIAREEFASHILFDKMDFSKAPLKTSLAFYKQKFNSSYEELGCIGYNATFKELTAVVKIKKSSGYLGNMSTEGSYEYVRFYIDYEDGEGWEDVGVVNVNVHDILRAKDCDHKEKKEIHYVVRLPITPKKKKCNIKNTPKVKAVLLWNVVPKENDPNCVSGSYVWGDKKEAYIQIEPYFLPFYEFELPAINAFFESVILNPSIPLNQLIAQDVEKEKTFKKIQAVTAQKNLGFGELVNMYKSEEVASHRFGQNLLQKIKAPTVFGIDEKISKLFKNNNILLEEALEKFDLLACDTSYEELVCVGADYHKEALVATVKIKKQYGFNGDACSNGSKEYVSFWIQNEPDCEWKHAGTASVNVYDVDELPEDGLYHSIVLPYNFEAFKNNNPNTVLKVRAVLSWNTEPSGMDCSKWGNTLESYIQLQTVGDWDGVRPKLFSIGGIPTTKITNSGLTSENVKIGGNNSQVAPEGAAFAGWIIAQGISNTFIGQKYRVKIKNLDQGGHSYYLMNEFNVLTQNGTYESQSPDTEGWYTYLSYQKNATGVLANFRPGTNERLEIIIENSDGTHSDAHIIQMHSTPPEIELNIVNYGNCNHFKKGGELRGDFTVYHKYLRKYALRYGKLGIYKPISGIDPEGDTNGSAEFRIDLSQENCGEITLTASSKVIVNSIRMASARGIEKNICLTDAGESKE
jgi:hypothetical protein